MTTLVRRVTLTVVGIAAFLLAAGALAWACTAVASPSIELSPQEGQAGTSVRVTGDGWQASEPLELQWRTGDQGYLQAFKSVTADSSGKFATTITIPDSSPDYYYVAAVQGSADTARPFHVTTTQSSDGGGGGTEDPNSSSTSGGTSDSGNDGSTSGSTDGGSDTQDGGTTDDDGQNQGSDSPTTSGGTSDSGSDGSTSGTADGGSDSSGSQDSGTTSGGSTSDSGTSDSPTSQTGSTDSGEQQPNDSEPSTSTTGAQQPATTADSGTQHEGRAAPDRSQTNTGVAVSEPAAELDTDGGAGDRGQGSAALAGSLPERDGSDEQPTAVREPLPAELWSDLAVDDQGRDSIGLADRSARDPLAALAEGVGLLAFGMLALALGFGVAEARRRRIAAQPTDRD